MTTARCAGWILIGVAIVSLVRAARLDRRLQRYRSPGSPRAAYLGPVGRWRRSLYTTEGQSLIGPTRWAYLVFCAAALVGALLLESGR
jgi:hypothetical protein